MARDNETLFDLIHVLTASEKKYISALVTKSNGEFPMYFRLFQWISKQTEPNESHLKKKLGKLGQEKQLPYLKNYLYHFILDKMFILESESSLGAQVNKFIVKSNLLIEKGLWLQAETHLKKALKLAEKAQDFGLMARVKRLQTDVVRKTLLGKDLLQEGTVLYESGKEDLRKMINEWEYEEISFQFVNRFMYINRARSLEEEEEYALLLTNPLLLDESNALTFKSLRLFHNIHGTKSLYERDFDNFYYHSKRIVDSFEGQEDLIENDLQKYISALYNYSKSLVNLKKFQEVDEVLTQIEKLKRKYPKQVSKPKNEVLIYSLSMLILVNYGLTSNNMRMLYEKTLPYLDKFEAFRPKIRVITQLYLVRTFSFVHFVMGKYEEALDWDIFFLKEYADHDKSRMYLITKLSFLILHFELGSMEYLPYVLRSTYRFLKKRNSDLKFEKRIIKFLRTALGTINKEDVKNLFISLRDDLIVLAEDPKENVVNDFVYIEWLEHKITGKNLLEVIESKGVYK